MFPQTGFSAAVIMCACRNGSTPAAGELGIVSVTLFVLDQV
jgi:hypothetical protein